MTNNHENLVKDYSKKRWLILSLLVRYKLKIPVEYTSDEKSYVWS
jgi:hypothetical protein